MKTKCPKCGKPIDPRGLRGHLMACKGESMSTQVRRDILAEMLEALETEYSRLGRAIESLRNTLK